MARLGVTYQDIANAANQLLGQGKQPTIELIRHLLGTGSSTTIANHLRQWRAEQDGSFSLSQKENLPAEMITMMKGLWDRLMHLAQDKVTVIEASHQQSMTEAQQALEKYKSNNQRWQQLFNQWSQEKEGLSADKLSLEQAVSALKNDKLSLEIRETSLIDQIQEKQTRIDELKHLHTQAQTNLEHFREATREQRLIEQDQFDQQKQALQADNKILKDRLLIQRDQISSLQEQNRHLQQANQTLQQSNQVLEAAVTEQQHQLTVLEKLKSELQVSSQHWQAHCEEAHKALDAMTIKRIDSQAETQVLSQQLAELKQALKDMLNQNKLLGHEKWTLAQEKAQLEGQLKQMNKMIKLEGVV